MGLDMYLNRRCVRGNADTAKINKIKYALPYSIWHKMGNWSELVYWRKANMVHKWFVENVQDGKDDCGEYPVTKEDLVALRDVCEKAAEIIRKGKFVPFYYGEPKKKDEYWNRPLLRCPAAICKPVKAEDVVAAGKLVEDEEIETKVKKFDTNWDVLEKRSAECNEELKKAGKKELEIEWVLDTATAKKLAAVLPTESGFFFGPTVYGRYYVDDVIYTIEKMYMAIHEIEVGDEETANDVKWAHEQAKGNSKKLNKLLEKVCKYTYSYSSSW